MGGACAKYLKVIRIYSPGITPLVPGSQTGVGSALGEGIFQDWVNWLTTVLDEPTVKMAGQIQISFLGRCVSNMEMS